LSSSLLSENIKIRTHNSIILPVVLYGCETWSLTLRKLHRLRVLRIFGPKRDEVRCRWVDNIKIDLTETGWDGVDWIDMAQNKD
jgi:hypothetical protein